MKIEQFSYCDKTTDWMLEPVRFDNLNLLVGLSGSGKTRILRALSDLKRISEGKSLSGAEWHISLKAIDKKVEWSGTFEISNNPNPKLVSEKIVIDGNEIVSRTSDEFVFENERQKKLSPSVSAVKIFEQESAMMVIQDAFRNLRHSSDYGDSFPFPADAFPFSSMKRFTLPSESFSSTNELKNSRLSLEIKLFQAQEGHRALYESIVESFIEVFPNVEHISTEFIRVDNSALPYQAALRVKEKGTQEYVTSGYNWSSGMLKTFVSIAHLYLEPQGTVFLIDELENSLGLNCLDALAEIILGNQDEHQFIITSHHPYIINKIPFRHWKIVTRKGSIVSVKDASEFNLGKSKHEAFTQLINLEALQQGIET